MGAIKFGKQSTRFRCFLSEGDIHLVPDSNSKPWHHVGGVPSRKIAATIN
ncbi:hypothetical protein RSSM_06191 [Rhodopirellula sallentina SM41]|uniref:Uncharacterized protein n=1 Tax=Rhodopirellula sallentina SM41 TaxID=1263870 RepID=M5U8T2_9BACT|nr:hypothetical protein RSSM_06191 [Rhodopirellula sallentina SM41]